MSKKKLTWKLNLGNKKHIQPIKLPDPSGYTKNYELIVLLFLGKL